MKENTARVVAQLPIDVATYLLNEKRTVLEDIERRHSTDIVLVPNLHLETPHYDITRIRANDLTPEMKSKQSFELMTEPVTEIAAGSGTPPARVAEEPVIKTIMPEAPVPPPPPVAQVGIFVRLWRALFGTGSSKPRKSASPPRKSSGKSYQQQRGRKPQGQSQGQQRRRPSQSTSSGRRDTNDAQATSKPAQSTAAQPSGGGSNNQSANTGSGTGSGQGSRRGRRGGRRRRDNSQSRQQNSGNERNESRRQGNANGSGDSNKSEGRRPRQSTASTSPAAQGNTDVTGNTPKPSVTEHTSNSSQAEATPAKVYEAPRPVTPPTSTSGNEPIRNEPATPRPTGSDDNS